MPLQAEFFALEGLSQLLQTVERIRARFNPELSILGVALTMYDRRNNLSAQVADDVRACLGKVVFDTVIPRNVRLSEAPSHGIPALIYDHRCPGSEAYMALARELIARLPQAGGGGMSDEAPPASARPASAAASPRCSARSRRKRRSRGGATRGDVQMIPVASIEPHPGQPRRHLRRGSAGRARRIDRRRAA